MPEDFARLRFDLFFFTADVRNHVVEDRQRRNAVVAGAGDGLHRRHVELFDAPAFLDRRDGESESHRRAVRVRDDVAASPRALLFDRGEMVGVDLGKQQRDVGVHPMVLRIRQHRAASIRVIVFRFSSYGRIESGENESRFQRVAERFHVQRCCGFRQQRVESPVSGARVRFSRAALRGDDFVQTKPRVMLEQLHESLTDGSGGAEDGDGDAVRWRGLRGRIGRERCGHIAILVECNGEFVGAIAAVASAIFGLLEIASRSLNCSSSTMSHRLLLAC